MYAVYFFHKMFSSRLVLLIRWRHLVTKRDTNKRISADERKICPFIHVRLSKRELFLAVVCWGWRGGGGGGGRDA